MLEPARITEGILPLWMNRSSFYVAGGSWAKYSYEHPWGPIGEWWERREQRYDAGNAKAKRFWSEFTYDKEKQAKTLADRSLRCEIEHILDTDRPYKSAMGLLEPKPEPIGEAPNAGHFAYCF